MSSLALLIPAALFLGACGLAAFYWAVKAGQFDDLDGASQRVLLDDDLTQSADRDEEDPDQPGKRLDLKAKPKPDTNDDGV